MACASSPNTPPIAHHNNGEFWATFQEEWISLKAEEYRLYVFHNTDEFNAASDDIKQKGIKKWQVFFQHEPWPPNNPSPKKNTFPKPTDKQIQEGTKFLIEGVLQKLAWDYLW